MAAAHGMQLTVNLIEGAKWSDGDPFGAEDFLRGGRRKFLSRAEPHHGPAASGQFGQHL